MAGEGSNDGAAHDAEEFADRLAELKAGGSAVLVVGDDSCDGHVSLCRRLLGSHSNERRHRILVGTDGVDALEERLPLEQGQIPETTVISVSTVRGSAAGAMPDSAPVGLPDSAPGGLDVVELGDASLHTLAVTIMETFEAIQQRHRPLDATAVRVGLESVESFLDIYGEDAVFGFLTLLTRYFREFDILGHVHLRADLDEYVARLLAPLFDIVVEFRAVKGEFQHRWHLDDGAITSRWLST